MFGLSKEVRRDDPVFGSMLYMGDNLGYWEGRAVFTPTGDAIEIFVDGSQDGDMVRQQDFFRTVCEHWSGLILEIRRKVQEECHSVAAEELMITSISIPNVSFTDRQEWAVCFQSRASGHSISVQMRGKTPASVSWDT